MFFAVNVIFFAIICCSSANNSFIVNLRGRIVNGTETNIDAHPYQASIQLDNQHYCGGVLISFKHILTAAHCLKRQPVAYRMKVRLGSSQWRRNGITCRVKSFILHPDFDLDTLDMDVALIYLQNDVIPNMKTINTIGIVNETAINGLEAIASGWGITKSGEINFQDNLREIHLKIISRELCAPFYSNYQLRILRSMICASAVYRDVCFGDSGGPLVANGQLVGIVSWGYGCANDSCPGVYTDVSYMRPWIETNTK